MNIPDTLQILLGEFRDKIFSLKGLVLRNAQFLEAPHKIKVAIGMRRSGKTYFLYQKVVELIKEGVHFSSILYINFEDDRLLPLEEKKLAQLVDAFYALYPENHDRKCFLFFDEIQNVSNWSMVIRRLHDTKKAEIFLTGSSAKLLSTEIASHLRGRSLAIEIWPYSFSEFMKAKGASIDRTLKSQKTKDLLSQLFRQYLSEGGFPETSLVEADVRQRILQDYLDVVIYRDIVERHGIKNTLLVKYMILSMMHNAGRPFAIHKFHNDVKSQGYSTSKEALYEYAQHIEDAYLAFLVPLYDLSIRKCQVNPKKLYAIDPGMARALTLDYDKDLGRLFENVVFLDLRRQGYKVNYYLTKERYEVDFLIEGARGEKKLIQVAWDISDPKTLQREERALQTAMEELGVEGELVTLDRYLSLPQDPFQRASHSPSA